MIKPNTFNTLSSGISGGAGIPFLRVVNKKGEAMRIFGSQAVRYGLDETIKKTKKLETADDLFDILKEHLGRNKQPCPHCGMIDNGVCVRHSN